jgi:hypothetical protein
MEDHVCEFQSWLFHSIWKIIEYSNGPPAHENNADRQARIWPDVHMTKMPAHAYASYCGDCTAPTALAMSHRVAPKAAPLQ